MASANEERLPRLLALVPYLQARPNIAVAEAAADFGVTESQLRRDLTLLWMCGLPGHGPGDLIDLSFEGETVSVVFDAGMSRPLRLTGEEALALVVALRTLAETPGLADTDAVQRALAKVEAAAGGSVDVATIAVELDHDERLLPVLARAVDEQRALRLRYYSASRDETTERVVDPLRVFDADGRSYLEGWCRRAEGMRVFRLDRIDDAVLLDEPAAVPADVQPRDLSEGVFQPAAEHLLVDLRLGPAYAWVADYYPGETAYPDGDNVRVELRVADPGWVRALVLGSAGQIDVLSPDWLAEDVRADAERALAAYASR
jgi:proteasome accessory factor C